MAAGGPAVLLVCAGHRPCPVDSGHKIELAAGAASLDPYRHAPFLPGKPRWGNPEAYPDKAVSAIGNLPPQAVRGFVI